MLDAPLRPILRPAAALLAAFYGALATYWMVAFAPRWPVLGAAWAAVAAVLAVLHLNLHRVPRGRNTAVLGAIALLTVLADLTLLETTRAPNLTFATGLTILGWGLLLTSTAWLALVVGSLCVGWLLIAGAEGFVAGWQVQGFLVLGTVVVAAIAHRVRVQRLFDQERAHQVAVQQAVQEARVERLLAEAQFRSRFLDLVAHELSTPLTPLVMDAHKLGPEHARIARNVERLDGVVRDIIALTQLQARATPLARERFDLAPLLARRSGAEVPAGAGPLQVHADRGWTAVVLDRMGSVVQALLKPGTAGHLDAERLEDAVEVRWTFEPAHAAAHVQEQFEPLASAGGARGDLRLRIEACRAAVAAMGGGLGLRVGPGRATAWIRLPA